MDRIPPASLHAAYPDLVPAGTLVWCGTGWSLIVREALDALQGLPVTVVRVREHCAGLQVAVGPAENWTEESYAAARAVSERARERSRGTCEVCGRPGEPRIPGPGVRCDEHERVR